MTALMKVGRRAPRAAKFRKNDLFGKSGSVRSARGFEKNDLFGKRGSARSARSEVWEKSEDLTRSGRTPAEWLTRPERAEQPALAKRSELEQP